MIKVKHNKNYYENMLDWLFDIDRDHMNFVSVLQDLYKARTGNDIDFYLPTIMKLIYDPEDWNSVQLWNYKIHLSLYQLMAELGNAMEPPIIVIPKFLKGNTLEEVVYREYLMHKDIEEFILSLGG